MEVLSCVHGYHHRSSQQNISMEKNLRTGINIRLTNFQTSVVQKYFHDEKKGNYGTTPPSSISLLRCYSPPVWLDHFRYLLYLYMWAIILSRTCSLLSQGRVSLCLSQQTQGCHCLHTIWGLFKHRGWTTPPTHYWWNSSFIKQQTNNQGFVWTWP